MPSNSFDYRLRSSDQNDLVSTPRFAFLNNTGNASVTDVTMQLQCVIEFDIPANITPSVLLYYKLTNFYQNHRRYVQSYDANQLKGQFRSASTLGNSNCKPLGTLDGKPIYPCGLIANSIFNGLHILFCSCTTFSQAILDTFSDPVLQNPTGNTNSSVQTYTFSSTGIAWPGEAKKYVSSPIVTGGYKNLSDIIPPPNWAKLFPNNYTEDNPPPDLRSDERFQNWMRTAGLPTFTKLWGRNDTHTMEQGTYRIIVGLSTSYSRYRGSR